MQIRQHFLINGDGLGFGLIQLGVLGIPRLAVDLLEDLSQAVMLPDHSLAVSQLLIASVHIPDHVLQCRLPFQEAFVEWYSLPGLP